MTPIRRIALAAAVGAAALLGFLAVQLVADPGSASRSGSAAIQGMEHSTAEGRSADATSEAPAGGRTPQGAAARAAAYLRLLDAASTTQAVTSQLRQATGAELTGQALAAESASTALERRIAGSGPAFVRGWRLGYRVDSYSPRFARISVWSMGMVQSRLEVLPPQFSTTVCTLRWEGDGWLVLAARTNAGPTPAPDGSNPSAVSAFVRAADTFEAFPDAP